MTFRYSTEGVHPCTGVHDSQLSIDSESSSSVGEGQLWKEGTV